MSFFIDNQNSYRVNHQSSKYYPLRDIRWIANSHRDVVDIWLNLILLLGLIIFEPIFNFKHQEISDFVMYELSHPQSISMRSFFITIGLSNLVRIFIAEKLKVIWIVVLQSLTFFAFVYLWVDSIIFEMNINEQALIYGVLSLVSLLSIFKSK